ncbi:MAG: lipid-binding protein [Owenweeksia sp.]
MKIGKIFAGLALVGSLAACEKEYESENLANFEMSGQWYVQTYLGTPDTGAVALGYVELITSNTAATNGNELLIDDKGNIWPFKVKCPSTPGSLTFGGTNLLNISDSTVTVAIRNGMILPNQGKSTSGIVVDSIYMEAEFSDDPGTIYTMAGHYRTGFEEDEH